MSLTLWQPKSAESQPLRRDWVEALIRKLQARYGTLFIDRYSGVPLDALIEEWGNELAGFTGEEIKRGLDGLRGCKFPPTLPEFMELCRPGIAVEDAFLEASRNAALREAGKNPPYSHPAIYWAGIEFGTFDLRNAAFVHVRGRWERTLSAVLARGRWDPIPAPALALPAPPMRSAPPPEIRAKLRDLVDHFTRRAAAREE